MKQQLGERPAFADWNPHFTPEWLSEYLVRQIPGGFAGTVIDPACGAGNLLVAAAQWLKADSRRSQAVHFHGIDVSQRAISGCQKSLAVILPNGNFTLERGDFLRTQLADRGPIAVVMNPPFKGYGKLRPELRRQIASRLKMKGRFNLGYAFVLHAIATLRPETLVALLPSNWIRSRAKWFRNDLDATGGTWEWEDVGDSAFVGINVHVGILTWRPGTKTKSIVVPRRRKLPICSRGGALEVRHGIATGGDAYFLEIAENPPAAGSLKVPVRGRDVARKNGAKIWVPTDTDNLPVAVFRDHVGRRISNALRTRFCVKTSKRKLFEYHESPPDWFLVGPKLLIPEIVSNKLRVALDAHGDQLPLHSTLAIRVPSISVGNALRKYLSEPTVGSRILLRAPRLSGGARRARVSPLRAAVRRWLMSTKDGKAFSKRVAKTT